MSTLVFVTGNQLKFQMAHEVCAHYGIELQQRKIGLDEIQSEDPERIARDKSDKAFAELKIPVITSDDSWSYPALNGFPGPYMHSINHWFSVEDFANLIGPLKDRSVVLRQTITYKDADKQQFFTSEVKGKLLDQPRGPVTTSNNWLFTVLDGDNDRTIAEVFSNNKYSNRQAADIWHQFAKWYKELR